MIRIYLLFIGIVTLISTTEAQLKQDNHFNYFFHRDHLDSLIAIYGEEETLTFLSNYKLSDERIYFNRHNFWYGSGIFLPRHFLKTNGREDEPSANSEWMKALFWSWVIYSDSVRAIVERPGKTGALYSDSISSLLFDYKNTYDNVDWMKSTFIPVDDPWLRDVRKSFAEWGELLRIKGLKFLRENHISPLNNKYRFKMVSTIGLY